MLGVRRVFGEYRSCGGIPDGLSIHPMRVMLRSDPKAWLKVLPCRPFEFSDGFRECCRQGSCGQDPVACYRMFSLSDGFTMRFSCIFTANKVPFFMDLGVRQIETGSTVGETPTSSGWEMLEL